MCLTLSTERAPRIAALTVFEQTGLEDGKVIGRLRPTGLRPKFMEKIEQSGIQLPASIFGVGERGSYR